MTQTLSAHNLALVASSSITLARCVKVTRLDSTVVAVTDHNKQLTVSSVDYEPTGYSPTDVSKKIGLSTGNLDIIGLINSDSVTEADLEDGKYNGAAVEIFFIDYTDTTQAAITDVAGTLGEVQFIDGQYTFQLRSLTEAFEQKAGDVYQPTCRYELGSSSYDSVTERYGCGVTLSSYTSTGTVATVVTQRFSFTDTGRTEADDYWQYGTLTWTAGANNGATNLVKRSVQSSNQIDLVLREKNDIAATDTYSITAGCNHLFRDPSDPDGGPYTGDCISKFGSDTGNGANFGGEPFCLDAALVFGSSAS